jgi:hypothetical protein
MAMYQPPGLISNERFLAVQGLLGSGYDGLVQVQHSLDSGLEAVALSTNQVVERDLLYDFDANATELNVRATRDWMAQSTLSLINHVQTRSAQTLNDYLFTRGMQVTQSFAELCSGLGHPVININVQG